MRRYYLLGFVVGLMVTVALFRDDLTNPYSDRFILWMFFLFVTVAVSGFMAIPNRFGMENTGKDNGFPHGRLCGALSAPYLVVVLLACYFKFMLPVF